MCQLEIRTILALILLLCAVAASQACDALDPQHRALERRSQDFYRLVSAEIWEDVYSYYSPAYKEICSRGDFVINMATSMTLFRSFRDIGDAEVMEWRPVKVQTAGREGRVHCEVLCGGRPIDFGSESAGERWVFHEEQWWVEPDAWQRGWPLEPWNRFEVPTPDPLQEPSMEGIPVQRGTSGPSLLNVMAPDPQPTHVTLPLLTPDSR